MVEEISGMLALYPDEEVERASRCHGHQQKVIASRHEFDTCPLSSTEIPRVPLHGTNPLQYRLAASTPVEMPGGLLF